MKKHSKAILLGLGALLVVIVFGSLCLHGYIQSARSQERIQAQLSQALGMPLKLTNTSFTPWGGVKIKGITISQRNMNFLEAGSFTASYRILPLFVGKVAVPEMRVDRPKIVWKQNAEGKWKLPALEKAPSDPQEGTTPEKAKTSKQARDEPALAVERIRVVGGAVEMLDKDGKPIATFTDVTITCTTVTEARVEGTAVIGRAVWAEALVIENVCTPFTYAAGELTLPALTGTLGGGALQGKLRAHLQTSKSPFEATLTFENADLDQLATNAGWKPGQVNGRGAGQLTVQGDLGNLERVAGPGQFQIRDGRFKQLEFFQIIGKALDIRELSDLRLKDGSGEFRLSDKKVHIEKMTLSALNLQLGAKGTVGFDQKVDLAAQLGLEEDLLKQLPELLRESFGKSVNGQRSLGFKVTGTTDKLRTNLLDQLIGQKVGRQFDDLLTGLFGTKNKDDEKKKKEEEDRKKEEKKKKKEQEKAAAKAAIATGAPVTANATPPPAATPRPAGPATTTITPIKP